MTQKHILFPAMLLILCVAVGCHGGGLSRDQRAARRAAERCYRYLCNEDFDSFVDEIAYADRMSEEYRSQMRELVHESVYDSENSHGRMLSAVAVGDTLTGDVAHVYLQVTYADSTSEAVGLPMIRIGGDWKMQ